MKEVSKGGVAKLGLSFRQTSEKKNRSDEDNFLIQKNNTLLPKRYSNSDLCIFITKCNIFHFSAHGL